MSFMGMFLDKAEQKAMDVWMSYSTSSRAGASVTWAMMSLTNAAASVFNLFGKATTAIGASNAVATQIMDEIQQALILPNFMGIPMYSATEIVDRQVDVCEQPTIVQNGAFQQMNVDNSVPRLRTWQYDAYLKTLPGLEIMDSQLLIKPTLQTQEMMLDRMATSRQPGWLKTSNGVFELALISSLHIEHVPNITNAVHINIAFKEYKPITVSTTLAEVVTLAAQGGSR